VTNASNGNSERISGTVIGAPRWEHLRQLVNACEAALVICSPWISSIGVTKLEAFIAENPRVRTVEIWTRLTEVATDSRNLLRLTRTLTSRDIEVILKDSQDLHLKVYLADRFALFGSANLTHGGFANNPEIIVSTSEPTLLQQIELVLSSIVMDTVTVEELDEFVSAQLPELELRERNQPSLEVRPPWRDRRTSKGRGPFRSGTGRRAFLLGSRPGSGSVQKIVKIADWGGRSVNIYDLIDESREKLYPIPEADLRGYVERGVEIDEPYIREESTAEWVRYGRDSAAKLGFQVARDD